MANLIATSTWDAVYQLETTDQAVGGNVPDLRVDFRQPLSVNAGNYLHVILKIPVGTATASQIVRGVVAINATWE